MKIYLVFQVLLLTSSSVFFKLCRQSMINTGDFAVIFAFTHFILKKIYYFVFSFIQENDKTEISQSYHNCMFNHRNV